MRNYALFWIFGSDRILRTALLFVDVSLCLLQSARSSVFSRARFAFTTREIIHNIAMLEILHSIVDMGLFHRNLSEPWAGFTQFTILNDKPPDGYVRSRECEHYTTPAHISHFGTRDFSHVAQVQVVCVLLKRSSSFLVCHVSFMRTVT